MYKCTSVQVYKCKSVQVYLPETRDGVDVPVTHGGHGDHHPVDASGDGCVLGVLVPLLDEVAQAGEYFSTYISLQGGKT